VRDNSHVHLQSVEGRTECGLMVLPGVKVVRKFGDKPTCRKCIKARDKWAEENVPK
jgi:hypothetical protein